MERVDAPDEALLTVPARERSTGVLALDPDPANQRRAPRPVACTVGRRGGRRPLLRRLHAASPSSLRRSSRRLPPMLRFAGSTRSGHDTPCPNSSAGRIETPLEGSPGVSEGEAGSENSVALDAHSRGSACILAVFTLWQTLLLPHERTRCY